MALKWVKENCVHFGGDPNNISKSFYRKDHTIFVFECKLALSAFMSFFDHFNIFLYVFQAVFGGSAGACSISMHMLSHQSKNLFHKAIMMSGTAYTPWTLSRDGGDYPQRLAKELGWNGMGGELACLRILQEANAHSIVQATDKLMTIEDYKQMRFIAIPPVLEPYETSHCFLRKFPSELIDSAWSKHVPTIIGTCANEGLIFYKCKYCQC